MESNEEYLLRAMRRTSSGLTDSLIPAHGAKLTKLLNKFESAEALTGEVQTLMHVQGFGKCALAMEWLLERTKRSSDFFSPEQFESDVLLLNEKLFEAFLNQPFDMPDFSRSFEAPVRPVQHIQVSDDEFMGTNVPAADPFASSDSMQELSNTSEPVQAFAEPSWDTSSSVSPSLDSPEIETLDPLITDVSTEGPNISGETVQSTPAWDSATPSSVDQFESALMASSAEQNSENASPAQSSDASPSLRDSMTPDLFESSERAAQTAVEFMDKSSGERPVAMAVFRVTVRAASESAKSSSNLLAQDFYDSVLKLISFADEQGKIKTDTFANIVRDVGDRLMIALSAPVGGVTHLKNLTNFLKDPKELFNSR